MSQTQNKQSVRQSREDLLKAWTEQYYDRALNKGDMTVVDEICGDAFLCINNLWQIEGADGIKASMNRIRSAFSDVRFTIEEYFIEENVLLQESVADKVCIWWSWTGTFNGELSGIQPTSEFLTVHGASLLLVKDFKLIGARALSDVYQIIGQLPLSN
jgi:predicted ester cyclase